MRTNSINPGLRYNLDGDILCGRNSNGTVRLMQECVTRKVTRIVEDRIYCECGRVFLFNENLKATPV